MKRQVFAAIFFVFSFLNIQKGFSVCIPPIVVCDTATLYFNVVGSSPSDVWLACVVPMTYTGPGPIIRFTCASSFVVRAYGRFTDNPCATPSGAPCDSFLTAVTSLTINVLHGIGYGEYYLFKVSSTNHPLKVFAEYLLTPNPCYTSSTELPCTDCLPSFDPKPDSSYVISAWIKDAGASVNTTTYTSGSISVSYTGSSHVSGLYQPHGQIIDGWQRLEDTFKIPHTATKISMHLNSDATSFFDDIRVFPYKGSMKTYVFDPLTLRLAAELDERNYATIYEYDEEGKLTRVKKETERGIMTIQENRSNTSK